MKIKNIKINNYGILENKEINLENKINIIYGKNESGKSTLLNYIKNVFYGISKNKNGKEISDYEKYKPWGREEFSGKLSYELDSGEHYEVYRDFNKKNPKVFNGNLEEISDQFNIDKKDGSKFFYEQTKVDELMFLSTIVSMQQEVRLGKQEQGVLVQRIANLAGTGDDNLSFGKAQDKLSKRQVDEIGTDRTQGKPINVVKNKMKQIEFVIKDIEQYKNSKFQLEENKEALKEKLSKLEIEQNLIKNLNKVKSEMEIEQRKVDINKKLLTELEEKENELKKEKNNLEENKLNIISKNSLLKNNLEEKNNKKENKKSKKIISFFILFILVIIIKLMNVFYIKNNILNILNYSILPIYFIYIYFQLKKEKNKKNKIEYENKLKEEIEQEKIKNEINIAEIKMNHINEQIEELQKEKQKKQEEINQIHLQLDTNMDLQIEKIKQEYLHQINIDDILDMIDFHHIQEQLTILQERINQNKLDLHRIELEEGNILPKLDNMITLQEEYKNLEEEQQELLEKNECIVLAKEYLNKAYQNMKQSITPKFTQNLSKTIFELSNGKYNKVTINDEKGLVVENEYGEYVPASRLSVGTIDQLYLSLRLSMLEEIAEEKMPIILDETFAYYDENRLQNILKFLIKKAQEHQIIIFTCTNREKNILNQSGVDYNLVELS